MPNPASGVFKQLAYKAESTYGTVPSAAGAQSLRRVTSTIDLTKDTYQSAEIRSDQQIADMRHGVRRVTGQISGELSPGTYEDFFAQVLRRDFAAVTAATSQSLTIAGSGPYTITRASGSYLTDGFKVGDVVRITAGSVNASNLNKNVLVTGLTTTVITGVVLNGSTMVAEGPISGCTIGPVGKKTFIPASGQTDKSFSIEHFYSDLTLSEVFSGCKATKISIGLPPTGMVTVAMDFTGQNITTAGAQYFTSPTAATTTGCLASVNGVLRIGGSTIATVTGLTLDINASLTGDPVVGSNFVPNQFPGRVLVSGQATAYFDSVTLRDAFINETEIDMIAAFTASSDKDSKFMSFVVPRMKLGGASKNDGEGGLIQTIPFTALLNTAGGTGISSEYTTLSMQDSDA
jgi:Phage tail tube protein